MRGIIPKATGFRSSSMTSTDTTGRQAVPRALGELVRFGVVGVAHNLLGYLVYLLVTWLGTDPKIAVAILYPLGTLFSYFANRHWTFNHKGAIGTSMTRYLGMHVMGYALNLVIIYVGVDLLAFPHQLVQLMAMGVLAMMFFAISKLFVFQGDKDT